MLTVRRMVVLTTSLKRHVLVPVEEPYVPLDSFAPTIYQSMMSMVPGPGVVPVEPAAAVGVVFAGAVVDSGNGGGA